MGEELDVSLVGLLTNFGLGGIVILLIATGVLSPKWIVDRLEREITALKTALETERQRNAELAGTTGTTARLVQALTEIAMERNDRNHTRWQPPAPGAAWEPPALEPGGQEGLGGGQ